MGHCCLGYNIANYFIISYVICYIRRYCFYYLINSALFIARTIFLSLDSDKSVKVDVSFAVSLIISVPFA